MRNIKAQAAAELLTVYGWVVLFLLIVLVVAYYSGYLDIGKVLPTYCSLAPNMACNTFRFGYMQGGNGMILLYRVVNGVGNHILFANNSITLTAENVGKYGKVQYNGTCAPTSSVINPGTVITCYVIVPDMQAIPSIGNNLDLKVSMNYKNCDLDPNYLKTGDCSGAPQYSVGGSIRTPMEPAAALYTCGDGVCDYEFGENAGNCCQDCPISSFTFAANLPAVACSPTDPTCNGANYKISAYQEAELVTTAIDSNGLGISNATVNFTKLGALDQFEYLTPSSNTTNTSGKASTFYSSQIARDLVINATSCGTSALLKLHVNNAPPNGTLLFTWYPNIAPAGGSYRVNVTVYNMSGKTVSGVQVLLAADSDSTLSPSSAITDANGVAQFNLSSNLTHVARLIAKVAGMWNATNLIFAPPIGRLIIWNNGPIKTGSENSSDISVCLYTIYNNPISDTDVSLTTNFGYFMVNGSGVPKLPSLQPFVSKAPFDFSQVPGYFVGNETFAISGSGTTAYADPIEIDAYSGKLVKIHMTNGSEQTKAKLISEYLAYRGLHGRTVYIFYNTSYGSTRNVSPYSFVTPALLFNNLTQALNSKGIPYTTISDPYALRDMMTYNASSMILISANEYLPTEAWGCEGWGGYPKIFFRKGGIQIHTGNAEYFYAIYSNKTLKECGALGDINVFGYVTTSNVQVMMDPINNITNSTTGRTYAGGCFNVTSPHPALTSDTVGIANVTATFFTMTNSTLVNFVNKTCPVYYNGAWIDLPGGSCNNYSQNYGEYYCMNGFLSSRCDICNCSSTELCNYVSGTCAPRPNRLILTVETFNNGTGSDLPNDNYTYVQVIAQLYGVTGQLVANATVSWNSSGVVIDVIACSGSTDYPCGEYSNPNSPSPPRASVYVRSNGSFTGLAFITATVNMSGVIITNSTNISVYGMPKSGSINTPVNPGARWLIGSTILPADNYTNATIYFRLFDKNDSSVGNAQVCFSTSLGTFANGSSSYCASADRFGRYNISFKSGTPGNANITMSVLNSSGQYSRFYLTPLVTFYPIPSTILIKMNPNPAIPCADCGDTLNINATLLDSTGNPIPNVPYVYFYNPNYLFSYNGCNVAPNTSWGYYQDWCTMAPAYMPGWSYCMSDNLTTGYCSAQADASGVARATLSSIYPPSTYPFKAEVWYQCNSTPFYADNCLKSVSNISKIKFSSIPAKFIIDTPIRKVKPDGIDSVDVTFTLYNSSGAAMRGIYYYGYMDPDTYGWWVPDPYYTDPSGKGIMRDISNIYSGNYTLTFYTYYFNDTSVPAWTLVSNSTIVKFEPLVKTIIVNASPATAYANGVFGSLITVTLTDTDGNPMSGSGVEINPPDFGTLSCYPTTCSGLQTDAQGQVTTYAYSTTAGDLNLTAFTYYGNGTSNLILENSTILTFKPPPSTVVMTATPSTTDNSGVSTSLMRARFIDADSNPTPGIPVNCNSSDNAVVFPNSGLVTDSNGEVFTTLSATDTPATVMCWYSSSVLVLGSTNMTVSTLGEPSAVRVSVTAYPNQTAVGSPVSIFANVTDYTTGAPKDGKTVAFKTSSGGVLNMSTAVTNSSGIAVVNATALGAGGIFVNANVSGDFGVVKVEYT